MAAFEILRTTDLKKPLRVEALDAALFTGDEDANVITIEVLDGGQSVTLSGNVYGYFIRSDGMTVDRTGTITGNRVSVVLPATAYYHEGYLDIAIKVDTGSEKLTVYAARAFVFRSTSNNYVDIDPSIPIPSLLEILQKIQDCEDATEAANTAAGALNNMDATATGLAAGADPTANVTQVDGHYRINLGIPAGATGATGATPDISIGTVSTLPEGSQATATMTGTAAAPVLNLGIPVGATGATGVTGATGATGQNGTNGTNATVSGQIIEYQASNSGTTVPTGTWSTTVPTVPQGAYLWARATITWNNGAQSIIYSISRNGVDGSGSVVSVNGYSPDGSGNVELPFDPLPTLGSTIAPTSGGVYVSLLGKQDVLTFDQLPASASTNPVTSGGIYSALTYKQDVLTWDATPTQNSTNPVTSGGVYAAIAAIDASGKVSKSGDTMTGSLTLAGTDGLIAPNAAGWKTDQYGSLVHKRNTASDVFAIKNSAGTIQFGVVYETGAVTTGKWQATAVDVAHGGTGATTAAAARTNLGLSFSESGGVLTITVT